MSSHVFHELFVHINWHVKKDRRTLTPQYEAGVHRIIEERSRKMEGVYLHGINGTETHVHLAMNIEPYVKLSEVIKDLKGGSSHETNQKFKKKLLYWQRGYGVVSFGKNNLGWVLDYIERQKEHHARNSVVDRLESNGEIEDDKFLHLEPPVKTGGKHQEAG